MAVVVFILVASAAFSVKKQTEAYASFTETVARPAPIADLANHDEELNSLVNRIRHFDHEMENDRAAELVLSVQDLNFAFAHYEVFKNFRGQLSFTGIANGEISGIIHYPFRSTSELPSFVRGPLKIEVRDNNLNGTFVGIPLLTDGKLILNLASIKSTVGEVPDEWFSGISRILVSGELEKQAEDDPKNLPELLLKLRKITSLRLGEDELLLIFDPSGTAPSVREQTESMAVKATHLIALGAVIFILTMILFFVLMARRKKKR